jgi:tape measure domain-containing protein
MARGVEVGRGFIAVDVEDSAARAALSSFGSAAATAFKAVAAITAVAGAAVVKMGFQFNALKEQSLIAFGTLLGSGQKAQEMFASLQKFAASTPFELPGLVDNARQLLGVGVAADKIIPTLTSLGDTAGALGINQEGFNRVLLAVSQSMGKGKLQGEELMQMVENGIPVWQLLSKALGKTVPELQKMSSEGKLISQDVLPKLFAQMSKDYGGSMIKQSQTLTGVMSSLKDNVKMLSGTAMEPLFSLVKSGVGIMGELAASPGAMEFAQKVADGMDRAGMNIASFARAVKDRYGEDIRIGFDKAMQEGGKLWDSIKENGAPAMESLVKFGAAVLPSLMALATAAGSILRPALEAVGNIMDAVGDNADEIASGVATAASVVASVAGPAMQIFGIALKVVAEVLALTVDLIGDLSGPLGIVAGILISGAIAWRLFGTAIVAASVGLKALAPAAVAASMTSLSGRLQNAALSAGVFTEKVTKSANAGEKVAVAGSKMGTALSKVGAALPVIAIAAAVVGIAWENSQQSAKKLEDEAGRLGQALVRGGTEGVEASKKMQQLEETMKKGTSTSRSFWESLTMGRGPLFGGGMAQLNDAIEESGVLFEAAKKKKEEYERSLGAVGIAQERLTQAQRDYDSAVKEHGSTSGIAIAAQGSLVEAQKNLDKAHRDTNASIRGQEQALFDLTTAALTAANADLQLRQSQEGVRTANVALRDAITQYGASSNEASAASLNLESAMLRSAEAARAKAAADNAGKSAADQAKAANGAYTTELIRMGHEAGANAPAALQRLVGGLNSSQLSAAGARVEINAAGQAVLRLPDGRTMVISAENSQALREIAAVQAHIANVQRHAVITMQVRIAGGMPAISNLKALARGGTSPAGEPFIVGEEGPEMLFSDKQHYVATASQTSAIKNGFTNAAGSGSGDNWNIYGADDPYATALYVQRTKKFNDRLR